MASANIMRKILDDGAKLARAANSVGENRYARVLSVLNFATVSGSEQLDSLELAVASWVVDKSKLPDRFSDDDELQARHEYFKNVARLSVARRN